jgi:hypothetical protein
VSASDVIAIITAVGAVLIGVVREWRTGRDMRELRLNDEARFEQAARRERRARRESSSPPPVRARQSQPAPEFVTEETTDIHEIRAELSSRGLRPPRRGSHHDKER